MGVSVRLSRNTRLYLPFWFAIPAYMIAVTVWLVIAVAILVVYLVRLPFRLRRRWPG
jgi:hypothetical protein